MLNLYTMIPAKHSRGMSLLLELLLGFSILAVALLALFGLFPSGDKAVMRSIRMSQANELARGLVEEQMGKHYSSLVDGSVTGSYKTESVDRDGQKLATEFLYQVDILQPDSSRNYRDIKVEVWWTEGWAGRRHSCKLQSSKGEFF